MGTFRHAPGLRVLRRARRATVVAVAVLVATTMGCAASPSAALRSRLDQATTVQLRGPGNPTLDPAVVNAFWDTATIRAAVAPPSRPRPAASAALSIPRRATPPDPSEPAGFVPAPAGFVRDPLGAIDAPNPAPAPLPARDAPARSTGLSDVSTAPAADVAPAGRGVGARTIGRLLFTMAGRPRTCTAAVVAATRGSVIATAGHCLLSDGADGPRQEARNVLFLPGYHEGATPAGRWTVRSVHLTEGWQAAADWSQDVAFLRLDAAPDTGRVIAELTGAQGLTFTTTTTTTTTRSSAGSAGIGIGGDVVSGMALFGYPATGSFTGTTLRWCISTHPAPADARDPEGVALRCAMTAGYSGGPVLTGYDTGSGSGYLAAIASHDYGAGIVYAARLGPAALAAYLDADR